jgi:hypothetical protein
MNLKGAALESFWPRRHLKGMTKPMRVLVAITIGAVAGYCWHRLVGCSTGACPITANPYISTLYGAMVGLMIALG